MTNDSNIQPTEDDEPLTPDELDALGDALLPDGSVDFNRLRVISNPVDMDALERGELRVQVAELSATYSPIDATFRLDAKPPKSLEGYGRYVLKVYEVVLTSEEMTGITKTTEQEAEVLPPDLNAWEYEPPDDSR